VPVEQCFRERNKVGVIFVPTQLGICNLGKGYILVPPPPPRFHRLPRGQAILIGKTNIWKQPLGRNVKGKVKIANDSLCANAAHYCGEALWGFLYWL